MDVVIQKVKYCKHCKQTREFLGNGKKINWIMHIALIFFFGLGLFTLIWVVLFGGAYKSPILFCKVCGNSDEKPSQMWLWFRNKPMIIRILIVMLGIGIIFQLLHLMGV